MGISIESETETPGKTKNDTESLLLFVSSRCRCCARRKKHLIPDTVGLCVGRKHQRFLLLPSFFLLPLLLSSSVLNQYLSLLLFVSSRCVALLRASQKTPNTGQNRIVRAPVRASVAQNTNGHIRNITHYIKHFYTTQYDFVRNWATHVRSFGLRTVYNI